MEALFTRSPCHQSRKFVLRPRSLLSTVQFFKMGPFVDQQPVSSPTPPTN